MEVRGGARTARLARTAVAMTVLLGFWGALARSYWPELFPLLLRAVQATRGVGAKQVDSACFDVRDNSSADELLVRQAIERLEADYAAVQAFLGDGTDHRIPVLIADGSGPAFTDGARLSVFYDGNRIDLATAPFFLVALREGDLSMAGTSLFVEGGFAVYVVEEIGRAEPVLGQSSDAWVAWLRQNGSLLPLGEARSFGLPLRQREMPDAVRVLLQGGSFVRWVAHTYGPSVVQDLRDGLTLEDAVGLSLAETERAWLDAVAAQALRPEPCARAVPQDSVLYGFCKQLDRAASSARE
jgi:hypothetical protein